MEKGFTLIELLVVIAIIALLLSILMPSLQKVKDKTKAVICRNNLKQMQLASTMYNTEYDGKMFLYDAYIAGGTLWIAKMEPFIGDVDAVRYCPSTRVDVNIGPSSGYAWHWGAEAGSYAINGYIYYDGLTPRQLGFPAPWWPPGVWENIAYQSLSNVIQTSNTPCFADCAWVDRWIEDTDDVATNHDLDDPWSNAISHMGLFMMDRHGSVGNVSFVDGHASAVKLSDFWSLKWHKQFQISQDKKRVDGSAIYQ